MPKAKAKEAIDGWLDTVAAFSTDRTVSADASHDTVAAATSATLRPASSSLQPLLRSFQKLNDTQTAAPILVGRTIAEGGMGIVKLAEQEALGRQVVVKTLREDYAADAAEHVLREAWATGALEHPNIVPVHDIRVDDKGAPVIVLKRIEGSSWASLMHDADTVRERFGADQLEEWNLEILRQVMQAVRFAHSRGILHRDLKPDNVMIGSFGEVYVVDWGIAMSLPNAVDSPLPSASEVTAIAGTPCYMAPEMLDAEAQDERTDVYLLGAILYQIISAKPPHDARSTDKLMEAIRRSEPEIPSHGCPSLSALCRKAMHRSVEARFASVEEMLAALQESQVHRRALAIADRARQEVHKMRRELESESPDRQVLYRRFGALRMGYTEALRTWPEHPTAQEELDAARVELAEYELEQHNPGAAHTLVAELDQGRPELTERIEKAYEARNKDKDELQRFRHDQDKAVGSRTRVFIILILGLVWTATPLMQQFEVPGMRPKDHGTLLSATLFFAFLLGGLWYWARESLNSTLFNRRVIRGMMMTFPVSLVVILALRLLEIDVATTEVLVMSVWFAVTMSATFLIDARFAPLATAYAITFLLAAQNPEWRYYAMSVANAVFTLNAVYIWYPRKGTYESGWLGGEGKRAEALADEA